MSQIWSNNDTLTFSSSHLGHKGQLVPRAVLFVVKTLVRGDNDPSAKELILCQLPANTALINVSQCNIKWFPGGIIRCQTRR